MQAGGHTLFSEEEKLRIGKFANEYGVNEALTEFNEEYGGRLTERTVMAFMIYYRDVLELQQQELQERSHGSEGIQLQHTSRTPPRVISGASREGEPHSPVQVSVNGNQFVPLIPEDLHSEIKALLRQANVDTYEMYHDPDDIHGIIINGEDVEELDVRLNTFLSNRPRFASFYIITNNIEHMESEFPDLSAWIELYGQPEDCLHNISSRLPTIELMLRGKGYLYVVTTAHSFLTPSDCHQLPSSSNEPDHILQKLTEFTRLRLPNLNVNDGNSMKIVDKLHPIYRHWYPANHDTDSCLACDMVMFRLDSDKVQSLVGQGTNNLLDSKWRYSVEPSIVQIHSNKQLQSYEGQRVICGDKVGCIQPSVMVESGGWTLGSCICFTLSNEESLSDGDCGSILYLVDKGDASKLYRLGMLVGALKCDSRIYQAVSLSWALKQLEDEMAIDISSLKATETRAEGLRLSMSMSV